MTPNLEPKGWESLAALLEYPRSALTESLEAARAHLEPEFPAAALALRRAIQETREWSRGRFEETHVRTFDLAANCVPWVGVHLFGEETFKRGALMARLQEQFEHRGFQVQGELPDHLSVLLRFCARLDAHERGEFAQRLLGTARAMADVLANTDNPYRFVVSAVLEVLERVCAELPQLEPPTGGATAESSACSGCGSFLAGRAPSSRHPQEA